MKRQALLTIILLLAPDFTRAATRRVPGQYPNIQAAIDACTNGDTVIVAPGTYSGSGNRDIDFKGKAITVRSTDPSDPNIVAATVIDCNATASNPHRGFRFASGEGRDSILEGLTVANGSARLQVNPDPSPSVIYKIRPGGAIYCQDTSPTIRRCVITDNTAYYHARGAGLYSYQGNPRIEYCVFNRNVSDNSRDDGRGGAINARRGYLEVINCLIYDNEAIRGGAGVYLWDGVIENSTIVNNRGTGIHGGTGRLTGSIVRGNVGNAQMDVASSFVVAYCNVEGGWPGERNIDADPRFVDANAHDYHLSSYSHCINAGDPCYTGPPGEDDIDREQRIMNGLIDIGADETPAITPVLNLHPLSMNVDAMFGENPPGRILAVRNTGVGTLSWRISESCPWLNVKPTSGECLGEAQDIVVSVDVTGLGVHTYECGITVEADDSAGSPQVVPVSLRVFKEVLHVPDEMETIQDAVDYVTEGGTVILAEGTYTGPGNRDVDLRGKAITIRSTHPDDPRVVAATIIDCNGCQFDSHRGFYVHDNESHSCVIAGLTITNGFIDGRNGPGGAGVFCRQGRLVVRNCTIKDSVALMFCPPTHCAGGEGGAILCTESNVMIMGCEISGNDGYGAVALVNCTGTIGNCSLTGNYGCAIYCNKSPLQIAQCVIVGNSISRGSPAGIYSMDTNTGAIVTNCTISDNSGTGIEADGALISNCILRGNSSRQVALTPNMPVVRFSNIEGGWAGLGNVDTDPCFVHPGHWQDPCGTPDYPWDDFWVEGDYHLKSQADRWDPNSESWIRDTVTSLCIDAGDPMSPISVEPFPNGGRVNMGAYGGTAEASKSYFGGPVCEVVMAGDINGDCKVDVADLTILAGHWLADDAPCSQLPTRPYPRDHATELPLSALLSWTAGCGGTSFDVYFGTTSPPGYRATQKTTIFDPGPLEYNTTYYWMIYQSSTTGPKHGPIWTFKTQFHLDPASDPFPPDGATIMEPPPLLSWTPSIGATSHDVYLGTEENALVNADRNSPEYRGNQTQTDFYPSDLEPNTIYYWRVDEVNADGATIGSVWTFRIAPPKRVCFPEQTPVSVNGGLVGISQVCTGQKVGRLDCLAETPGMQEIEEVQEHEGSYDCYDVVLATGESITVADEHYFLVDAGCERWVSVHDLKPGSILKSLSGPVGVTAVIKRPVPLTGRVYNLKIKDSDRYFVGSDGITVRDY
jgi:hypothetical protein